MQQPSHLLPQQPKHQTQHQRTVQVTGVVLLAHVAVAWLLTQNLINPITIRQPDKVIIASVVTLDTPLPQVPVPHPPTTKPPAQTKSQARGQSQPMPQLPTTPAVSDSAPLADAVPIISAAPVPVAAAPPISSSKPHPSGNAGPAITLPSTQADYLNNPPPTYPRLSRRLAEQGTVVVRVFINPEGRAEKAEIRTSSGFSRLDEAALEAVRRWGYVPGTRAGVPEGMWFNVPIRFVLD